MCNDLNLTAVFAKKRNKPDECKFKEEECYYCHKKGHIAKKCRAKRRDNNTNKSGEDQRAPEMRKHRQTTNYLGEKQESYSLYTIRATKPDPYCVKIKVDGHDVKMEVDTGASVTVIKRTDFPTNVEIKTKDSTK